YVTGNTSSGDSADYFVPVGPLPESETHGLRQLEIFGEAFGNLPRQATGYVRRDELEKELCEALTSVEQRPIVTLRGSGGVGKTSLGLRVAHDITATNRFQVVLWFSARDIDLLPGGAKSVTPQAITIDDVCKQFASLVLPSQLGSKPP